MRYVCSALHSSSVLGRCPALQVCSIFKAPIAIVSLVEKERQWFKSIVGLSVSETSRASSFCAWTLLPINPEVLVVEDATEDARC